MARPDNENTSNKIHQRKHKENQTRPYGLHASFLPLVGLSLAVPLPENLKRKKGEYKIYPNAHISLVIPKDARISLVTPKDTPISLVIPNDATYQSSDPEGCTYQSSDPEGYNYQSSDPEGYTYQ
ncbi:NBS-LRR type resistance protein [Cucumis melo var. makuwa]|uniref:NBS-LRR type resistance protein n=1 Tax=Cucumis melo var. makuwa TaxID=1194695 RepID=A0A5A7TWC4_CUCMM|nr:NBS-LRR type resistance protein [Cucumis melo var. makuwa]TYK17759.1 NBS-LRR type resistance protein [Cucumis melo var. makuwa]